ncbi:MAG: cytochrome P450 [Anaerolineae bacterium]|nr:cytochrome P450 [Anaerolineae bacterium]
MTDHKFPPGPPPAKNIIQIIQLMSVFRGNTLEVFRNFQNQYGDTYMLQFGEGRGYITSHPDLMHEVLVTKAASFQKDRDMKNRKTGLARFLGNGLLTSDGEFWKRQRKLAAPALHAKRIANYGETMVDFTLKMLDGWRDGQQVDVAHEMTNLTMMIVAKSLFNVDASSVAERVGAAVEVIQGLAGPAPLIPPWVPTPSELRKRRARVELDEIIYGLIRDWRAKGQDNGDLLSMLLLAEDDDGAHMTDEQARDEIVTLFLAGHETTANTLNWTWTLLAQHADVEAKLHEELDRVLGDRPPTLADLANLPYTEMVIKESMRIYPPAWIVGREAIEDVEVGEYFVPKGSQINLVFYFAHHDPRWWDAPEAFRPERFSPENDTSINKRAYIPFSSGPRVCIGNSFAMMEARLLLATIAQHYRLSLTPGQTVAMNPMITLNPLGGLPMTLHARARKTFAAPEPDMAMA